MARCSGALTALQLAVLLCCTVAQQVDRSEEYGATGTDVVIATVNRIRDSGIFPDDFQFLRRMAYVETRDGETAIEGNGGIWNVNSEVFGRVQGFLNTFRGLDFTDNIKDTFDFKWFEKVLTRQDLDVPLYSALTVMLRIHITKGTEIPSELSAQAAIWNVLLNGSPRAEFDFIRDVGALEREECKIKGVDMIFVMDESGSIGNANFEAMKQLAISITDEFEIGPDRTRVGWFNFNSGARVLFNLNTYIDKASLHQAIRNVDYSSGGTNIASGLQALLDSGFIPSAGAREDFSSPDVAIVVTDGQSDIDDIRETAARLREQRTVDVYAVGVGMGIEDAQLMAVAEAGIASNPSRNVFKVPNFEPEVLKRLQNALKARACFSSQFIEVMDLNANSATIPREVTSYISTACPPEGLTINACSTEGTVIIYISTTNTAPNSAVYDERIEIEEGKCDNTFIECSDERRKRQAQPDSEERIYMAIEGVEESNEYELDASTGDSSTPKVKLYCQRSVETSPQSVVVSCRAERELTNILCSVNNAPFQPCSLPWRVDIVSLGQRQYRLQVNVTDSLNLTDSAVIEYTVAPLVLDCSLNAEMKVECRSNNQLAPNYTVCTFNGETEDPCTLSYGLVTKGLPAGAYSAHVRATDVFESTTTAEVQYQVVEDQVSDDMVMSVPLDINPAELGLTASTLSLCYQVHAEAGKYFNILSDRCVSVNAHISRPHVHIDAHVMDQIGIRAVGENGSCYNIKIERENCAVSINDQLLPIAAEFNEEGIVVTNAAPFVRNPTVRIAVPNCGRSTIDDMFISCTTYNLRDPATLRGFVTTDVLQFGSIRGNSVAEPPHGLIGQFWGAFLIVQPFSADPATSRLPANRNPYLVTVVYPNSVQEAQFVAVLVPRRWGSEKMQCLYAGDRQGGRTGGVDAGPRPGSVIQGRFTHYEVEGPFSTQYRYSSFDENKCTSMQ